MKFWKSRVKDTMYLSHAKGLNAEYVEFLQSFKEGDKIVLFVNEDDTITMKKSIVKDSNEPGS